MKITEYIQPPLRGSEEATRLYFGMNRFSIRFSDGYRRLWNITTNEPLIVSWINAFTGRVLRQSNL